MEELGDDVEKEMLGIFSCVQNDLENEQNLREVRM